MVEEFSTKVAFKTLKSINCSFLRWNYHHSSVSSLCLAKNSKNVVLLQLVVYSQVGKLTSCTSGRKEFEYFGLGYIKRQNVSEGDTVVVGDAITGTVVEVPFLAGQRPPSRSSSS